jgi:hypothetical protein
MTNEEKNLSNMMPPPATKQSDNVVQTSKLVTDGFEQIKYPPQDSTINPPKEGGIPPISPEEPPVDEGETGGETGDDNGGDEGGGEEEPPSEESDGDGDLSVTTETVS